MSNTADLPEREGSANGRFLSRRDFITMGLGTLAAAATLEMGGFGFTYLRQRSVDAAIGGVVSVGLADEFPPESVTEFVDNHFFLVRMADSGFLAIYRRCPHLGCNVNWVAAKHEFYCPCHASSFDQTGEFHSAPVTQALDTFPIRIEDGIVLVDTTHRQSRQSFQPEQLVYA